MNLKPNDILDLQLKYKNDRTVMSLLNDAKSGEEYRDEIKFYTGEISTLEGKVEDLQDEITELKNAGK